MKKALLLIIFTALTFAVKAQQTPSDEKQTLSYDPSRIYISVEKVPDFPGGMLKFADYLKINLKYPDEARKNNVQGKVFVTFIVEKDGSLTDVKVIRGIGNGCDAEAVRLIKASPKWDPGMQNGEPVRVYYTLPIVFKL